MRVSRYEQSGETKVGYFFDDTLVPVAAACEAAPGDEVIGTTPCLLRLLPNGQDARRAQEVWEWLNAEGCGFKDELSVSTDRVQLLIPIQRPNKLFLLAGNYAKHIEEGGEIAAERAETFPYVFMKPPTTTLTHPGDPMHIPSVSPEHIDWELELAIVIGEGGKGIKEADALNHVAGYTIINDISDRKFRPNPDRKQRDKDRFFDWLHGKWHDSFCPCGPCIASASAIPDPQTLDLKLRVNGELHQDSTTAAQVFPVAAVIEFISSFVTLEVGDLISTGTPHGVGNAKSVYLRSGDRIEASIGSIGTLRTPVG